MQRTVMEVKKLFTNVDCFQAYHCVEVTDYTLLQLLEFNSDSIAYAYKRLPICVNKSIAGFSCFLRDYVDPSFRPTFLQNFWLT